MNWWQLIIITIFGFLNAEKLYKIEGRVIPNELFPVLENFPQSYTILLDNGFWRTDVQSNGKFVIYDVPVGNYTLNVVSNKYIFQKLRIDMSDTSKKAYNLREGAMFGAKGEEINYPLRLSPVKKLEYFMVREGFNITSLLSNPMLLMSLFSLVLVFYGPKFINSLDEETLRDVQATQESMNSGFNLNKYQDGPSLSERLAGLSK